MKPHWQSGQASVEYVGLIALVALALATVLAASEVPASGLPAALARAIVPEDHAGGPADPHAEPTLEVVEHLMSGELEEFLAYRHSPARDERLDYSTDLCSAPVLGSSGPAYDFTEACLRHDFGYRNYGPLGLLGERRREVDERFLADMREHCLTRAADEVLRCLGWAGTYYRAVRAFGWIPARNYD